MKILVMEGYSILGLKFQLSKLSSSFNSDRHDAYNKLCKITGSEWHSNPTAGHFDLLKITTQNIIMMWEHFENEQNK